jgi:hypothetical protein
MTEQERQELAQIIDTLVSAESKLMLMCGKMKLHTMAGATIDRRTIDAVAMGAQHTGNAIHSLVNIEI